MVASGKNVCANLNTKNPGTGIHVYFYSGLRKNVQGGVQFEILYIIQVLTFIVASGKPLKGGGVNTKKCAPLSQNLDPPLIGVSIEDRFYYYIASD